MSFSNIFRIYIFCYRIASRQCFDQGREIDQSNTFLRNGFFDLFTCPCISHSLTVFGYIFIADMAHTLHLQVVTEGVETPEQSAFLERNGCDLVQGYFVARPTVHLADLQPAYPHLEQTAGARRQSTSLDSILIRKQVEQVPALRENDDLDSVFELFRRSGRQARKGEGLGLAFVRNSVRRLGGDITVDSELGKGSTFILKFPTRLILAEAGDLV